MKGLSKLRVMLLAAVLGSTLGCSSSNAPNDNGAKGTLLLYVKTNTGGPSVGPLPGAPVKIENASGALVAELLSDSTGHASIALTTGTYTIDPQRVPARPTFYTPPPPSFVTIVANTTLIDTLYYWNPIVGAESSLSTH